MTFSGVVVVAIASRRPAARASTQQALDAGPHRDAAACGERGVVPGLGLVQLGHQFVEVVRLSIVRPIVVDIVFHPLLAAGDGEQLAVQGDVPVPVEAGVLEGLIEGGPVAVALGVGKRAVNVEEQGVECHLGCGG